MSNPIRRLTMRQHVHSWSGYGLVGCEFFKWLSKSGIHISIRAMAMDENFNSKVPKEMRAALVHCQQPEPWELLIHTPEQYPTPGKKTAFFTMFESSELAPKYVNVLNRAEIVIVPCKWNAECFAASGVKRPIFVVPLGIDPEIYTPQPIIETGPCVFGISGRTAHCAKRKGIQAAIDLFLKTFPAHDDENVRLHVKLHDDCKIDPVKDDRIKVFRANLENYEIARWLHGLTAFVSLARAEGWGLWQHQAMACGRPVVACKFSGTAEFMLDDFAIPFRQVPADSTGSVVNVDYRGFWAEPNEREAGGMLRKIYQMHQKTPQVLQVAGTRAAEQAHQFTWENATNKLIEVLENAGVFNG